MAAVSDHSCSTWPSLTNNNNAMIPLPKQPPTGSPIISHVVDPGGPVVIILDSGSEIRGFDPSRGRWIFSERKNPEYDFLRKRSKAVGPVS